jgi:hypothetical protein
MGPIRNPRWEQKRTEGYVIVSNTDPAIILSMFMLTFIFVIVCGLFIYVVIVCGLFIYVVIVCGLFIYVVIVCGLLKYVVIVCGLFIYVVIVCGLFIYVVIVCGLFINVVIVCGLFIYVVIVCGLFIYVLIVCGLFIYVLTLEIQLSREEGWDPIDRVNSMTSLCLSQDRTWISNIMSSCSVSEGRGDCSFC